MCGNAWYCSFASFHTVSFIKRRNQPGRYCSKFFIWMWPDQDLAFVENLPRYVAIMAVKFLACHLQPLAVEQQRVFQLSRRT